MAFARSIFVSHSQHDADIRTSFDTIFARAGVRSVCMEFEEMYSPPWQHIRNEMIGSEAVFLLLGPNVSSSIYTQNWIAFEVGLACALGKSVWVFEQEGSYIEFPIPYLTDYMIYDLSDKAHFGYVRDVIQGYGRPPVIFGLGDPRTRRGIPHGIPVDCGNGNCMSTYELHTRSKQFGCPSCRQTMELRSVNKGI